MEDFVKEITKKAGRAVMKEYGSLKVKYTKTNPGDVVTEADLLSTKIIISAIKEKYPDHGIISEEKSDHQNTAEYVWIVDPLDGSRNFSTRTPLFGVMVALAKNNVIELSAIYDPIQDEFFFAKKNHGAYRNGEKIACSETRELEHSFGCASGFLKGQKLTFMENLIQYAKKKLISYSAFISAAVNTIYVADGRRDWYFSAGGGVWDYAASSLLLSEAGCIVTNDKGKPWTLKDDTFVAANEYLHPKLLELVNKGKG